MVAAAAVVVAAVAGVLAAVAGVWAEDRLPTWLLNFCSLQLELEATLRMQLDSDLSPDLSD